MQLLIIFSFLILQVIQIDALYCYRCTSTQPGCATPFNWYWRFWGDHCPEPNDICVKIIERKDANEVITRECLSNLQAFRTDTPADHYEGCRPAAKDVRLGHYVNNSIKELDIHRNYYDSVTWCFCFLDHRCNSASINSLSFILLSLAVLLGHLYV